MTNLERLENTLHINNYPSSKKILTFLVDTVSRLLCVYFVWQFIPTNNNSEIVSGAFSIPLALAIFVAKSVGTYYLLPVYLRTIYKGLWAFAFALVFGTDNKYDNDGDEKAEQETYECVHHQKVVDAYHNDKDIPNESHY